LRVRHLTSVGRDEVATSHRSTLAKTRMRAHIRGAEKPTAAMINSIGSVVPAGACWRGGIRLCFAFIGSCFDNGGMNRQRKSCGQQQENRWQYFLPQHSPEHPTSPCQPNFQSVERLERLFPQRIHRLAPSRSARKAAVMHPPKSGRMCLAKHTSPIRPWNRLRRAVVAPRRLAARSGKRAGGHAAALFQRVWNEIDPEPADLPKNSAVRAM
jgi:hypothetical protein